MKLVSAGATDVGQKRSHNEDQLLIQDEDGLFVVCDGMGGHACGEVASQQAVEDIGAFFVTSRDNSEVTWPYKPDGALSDLENRLRVGIEWANFRVFNKASSSLEFKGMGTTCVSFHSDGEQCAIGHVGDSRCYRIRDDEMVQMTEDHSLWNEYRKMAQVTQEEFKNFAHKNIIVRALGMKARVKVDTRFEKLAPGDLFLLCSDGLSGEVEDDQLFELVQQNRDDLDQCCNILINKANENGGKDNVTVVLVRVDE